MNKQLIDTLQKIIDTSNNIVLLGGAGTSTDCGLPDFRGSNGLYSEKIKEKYKESPEVILSQKYYLEKPRMFFDFYRKEMIFDKVDPSEFHKKIADLERIGKVKAVITQNIDGLHQRAGSTNVIEIHGSSEHNYCRLCKKDYTEEYMKSTSGIPRCDCGGVIKPDVILYGEKINNRKMEKAIKYVSEADLLIVAGTSLTVYPASSLLDEFRGKNLVLINKEATTSDNKASLVINDSITEVFKLIRI